MEKVNRILKNEKFKYCQELIEMLEKDRIFCRHDIKHCVDVARITMLLSYEEGAELDKELVYSAALLHDIGRIVASGDHHLESASLAEGILKVCGFTSAETELIVDTIKNHGNDEIAEEKTFRGLFYRADKLSRDCYSCKARGACYWNEDKKNLSLKI